MYNEVVRTLAHSPLVRYRDQHAECLFILIKSCQNQTVSKPYSCPKVIIYAACL